MSWIRDHTRGFKQGGGPTNAVLAATVPAGRLLVVECGASGNTGGGSIPPQAIASISKPGGETNSWVRHTPVGTIGVMAQTEVWAIRTTVSWTSGTALAITLTSTGTTRYGVNVREFSGFENTLRSTALSSAGVGVSRSLAASVLAGDLVYGIVGIKPSAFSTPHGTDLVVGFHSDPDTTGGAWSTALKNADALSNSVAGSSVWGMSQYKIPSANGTQTFDVDFYFPFDSSAAPNTASVAALLVFAKENTAPNAPNRLSPPDGAVVNRLEGLEFTWDYSDPDPGDTQGDATLSTSPDGVTWTPHSVVSGSDEFYVLAGGTLAAGDYEWKVETEDQDGLPGPPSSTGHFTMVDPTDPAVITDPVEDQTVGASYLVKWTDAADAYQLRRVADDAGDPDDSEIYFQTPRIPSSAQERLVAFTVTGRFEHVQVRREENGLWSEWDDDDSDVRVEVFFEPPPIATRTLTAVKLDDDDSTETALRVDVTNPASVGDQPTALSNNVWVDDGDGKGLTRRAIGVAVNGSWTYKTPRSGVDYEPLIFIETIADNGGVSWSVAA